jgi:hypothetical protein
VSGESHAAQSTPVRAEQSQRISAAGRRSTGAAARDGAVRQFRAGDVHDLHPGRRDHVVSVWFLQRGRGVDRFLSASLAKELPVRNARTVPKP